MTRVLVQRHIAADPASIALLLAGPAAAELWPGAASVPLQRMPTAFMSRVSLDGVTGTVTLAYAPASSGAVCTSASLWLTADGGDARALRALGDDFLARLAGVAEARSRAA